MTTFYFASAVIIIAIKLAPVPSRPNNVLWRQNTFVLLLQRENVVFST